MKNSIDIDVSLYEQIILEIESLINDFNFLIDNVRKNGNQLTGELRNYYDSIRDIDIKNELTKIEKDSKELIAKIKSSLEVYKTLDEKLVGDLDCLVNEIFMIDNNEEFSQLSIDERIEYLEDMIDNYNSILKSLRDEYQSLYGDGIEVNYEDFIKFSRLLMNLNIYQKSGLTGHDMFNPTSFIDGNICLGIENTNTLLEYCQKNDVFTKIGKYLKGDSWQESGMSIFKNNDYDNETAELTFLSNYFASIEETDIKFYDMVDCTKENINAAKVYILNDMNYEGVLKTYENLSFKVQEAFTKQKDIISLQATIYNLNQAKGLLPFDEETKNYDFLSYLGKDYTSYKRDKNLSDMEQREVALYDYIYDKHGKDRATEYLLALTDTINRRVGLKNAIQYVEGLNKGGLDVGDFFVSGWEGFKDGNINFFDGIVDFFAADGVKSSFDYEMLYKAQLLSDTNEYNNLLSDGAKVFLTKNYQFQNSIGNMIIPVAVSFIPFVGKTLSSTLMFTSSAGNATEGVMQEGYGGAQSYLYGCLNGLSEVAFERLLGGIPGLSKASPGFKGMIGDMFKEGREEFLQEWIDAGLRAVVLGEPIDLLSTTCQSFESFAMGMLVSGAFKAGTFIPIKIGDKVVNISTKGEFDTYETWKSNFESQLGIKFESQINKAEQEFQAWKMEIESRFDNCLNVFSLNPFNNSFSQAYLSKYHNKYNNAKTTMSQLGSNNELKSRLASDGITNINYQIFKKLKKFIRQCGNYNPDTIKDYIKFEREVKDLQSLLNDTKRDLKRLDKACPNHLDDDNFSTFIDIKEKLDKMCNNGLFRIKERKELTKLAYLARSIELHNIHQNPEYFHEKYVTENVKVDMNCYPGDIIEMKRNALVLNRDMQKMPQVLRKQLGQVFLYSDLHFERNLATLSYFSSYKYISNVLEPGAFYTPTTNTITFGQPVDYKNVSIFDNSISAYMNSHSYMEYLLHEAAHSLDSTCLEKGSKKHFSDTSQWVNAMRQDYITSGEKSPTSYGKTSNCEDFAESFKCYCQNPVDFRFKFPNRMDILESVFHANVQ